MPETTDRPSTTAAARVAASLILLAAFVIALVSHRLVAMVPGYAEAVGGWPEAVRGLVQPARWMVLVLVGSALVGVSPRDALRALGLAVRPRHAALAVAFALACSAPMLGLGLAAGVRAGLDPVDTVCGATIWPLAEEILFRGFAFGLLVRRAGWNVWAAAVSTGVVFGAVHLLNAEVQAHEILGQLSSIGLIAAGGVVFAWLYYRWRFNLWIAVGLHAFMNLWYALFDLADTPIGSAGLIAARLAVPAIAITLTEIHVRRRSSAP